MGTESTYFRKAVPSLWYTKVLPYLPTREELVLDLLYHTQPPTLRSLLTLKHWALDLTKRTVIYHHKHLAVQSRVPVIVANFFTNWVPDDPEYDSYVFPTCGGNPITQKAFVDALDKAANLAGLPTVSPQELLLLQALD